LSWLETWITFDLLQEYAWISSFSVTITIWNRLEIPVFSFCSSPRKAWSSLFRALL